MVHFPDVTFAAYKPIQGHEFPALSNFLPEKNRKLKLSKQINFFVVAAYCPITAFRYLYPLRFSSMAAPILNRALAERANAWKASTLWASMFS